jgi:glycosyltransferase involved in cell wall biosynthesis
MKKTLSVIIPAYNEEKIIAQTIKGLKKELNKLDLDYEIIVVNDASTDKTRGGLEKINNIKLINHPYNKGYGASLKTGIKNTKFDLLLFFDGDGQHPVEEIPNLLKYSRDFDMVTGARIKKGYKGPYIRQPGKKLLNSIANYLTGRKIPDLNCGFRVIRKEELLRFLHIMPNGFSFSTTTTLAFIKESLNVKFIPIRVKRRTGKSTVKSKDALRMLLLILRIILLFSPLKVFLPVSLILFSAALLSGIYDIFFRPLNITDPTILLFISSLLIFFFGLLADQISAIRREIKK